MRFVTLCLCFLRFLLPVSRYSRPDPPPTALPPVPSEVAWAQNTYPALIRHLERCYGHPAAHPPR